MRGSRFLTAGSFWGIVAALVAFRFWFAAVLPFTGDEAYFNLWGERPSGGFYDHPPMVGWLLAGLLQLSRAEWVLRLPSIVLPFFLAAGAAALTNTLAREAGREDAAERARLSALLVLLLPADVWNVAITTDIPVVFFSFLSILAYVRAQRDGHLGLHALAGLCLGLAFLSKYFSGLLGIAYLLHVVFGRRDQRRWAGFASLVAAALPGPIYNLWWNSGHCWPNIMFNFFNRHDDAGLSWRTPLLYVATLLYLATPFLLFSLWRHRREVTALLRRSAEAKAMAWLLLVPCAAFGLMSLVKTVGLHWPLAFVPLFALIAAQALPLAALSRLCAWMAGFAAVHVLGIVVVSQLPIATWQSTRLYDGIVLTVRADELLGKLAPFRAECEKDGAGCVLAMDGYSSAATLEYHARQPIVVFGGGTSHARQDDIDTDYRQLAGKNLLVLLKRPPELANYTPYFDRVETREFELLGARYHLVIGYAFNYPAYRDRVLHGVWERFYRIPRWLPQRGCEFCERYIGGAVCP